MHNEDTTDENTDNSGENSDNSLRDSDNSEEDSDHSQENSDDSEEDSNYDSEENVDKNDCYAAIKKTQKHISSKEIIGQKFQCSLCEASYACRTSLFNHKKSVHEGKRYKCVICKKDFLQKSNLESHKERIHSIPYVKKFKMDQSAIEKRNKIIKKISDSLFECKKCQKSFTARYRVVRHIKIVHEGKKNKHYNNSQEDSDNSEEDSNYDSEENVDKNDCYAAIKILQKHISSEKEVHEGKKSYACNNCEKIFMRPRALKVHVETVHERKRHHCHLCEDHFAYKNDLVKHFLRIHKG